MAEHISWLVADEVAAGLKPAPEHAAGCEACQRKLQQASVARTHTLGAPEFRWRMQRASSNVPVPRRFRWSLRLAPALVLAAAAVLVVWIRPLEPKGERLKGSPTLELRRAGSDEKVTRAKVGARVSLALGGAGHRYGLVLAVDADGKVERMWRGEVPPGAAAAVSPDFEVTPGALTLFALYSDEPLDSAAAVVTWTQAVEQARREGRTALSASPPALAGEKARARTSLEVEAGP